MVRFPLALMFGALATTVSGSASKPPVGWFMGAGGNLGKYAVSLDRDNPIEGNVCAQLSSQSATPNEFSTLMQAAKADGFRGKRVRFTVQVKSKNVTTATFPWFRADRADGMSVAFDNMQGRGIKGNTNWHLYSLVLDIPESAAVLAYGVGLKGSGTTWLDAAQIEIVDQTVPTTGQNWIGQFKPPISASVTRIEPFNLGFEEQTEPRR